MNAYVSVIETFWFQIFFPYTWNYQMLSISLFDIALVFGVRTLLILLMATCRIIPRVGDSSRERVWVNEEIIF